MYEEIKIDEKTIYYKKNVSLDETGIAIKKEDLEDTIDLNNVVEEINDATN